jgi:transcriptional regulator with XRE-family HTH domain
MTHSGQPTKSGPRWVNYRGVPTVTAIVLAHSGFMTTGSVVVRRSLGRQLKALRVAAGKTSADVAISGITSSSKLQRIEAGATPIKLVDVWALCRLYGVDNATTDKLAEMAKNTSQKGWWEEYDDVMPSWFAVYVELEAAANTLYTYQSDLVPGLLQTPAYHRALIEVDPERSSESPEQQIRLRAERQRATFERAQPLHVVAILSQAVLSRLVGGKDVMDEQKHRLLELSQVSNVEVRVLPWEAGAYAAMKGAFNILTFDGDHPDVAYLETNAGGRYIEADEAVSRYRRNFDLILGQSIPIKEHKQ